MQDKITEKIKPITQAEFDTIASNLSIVYSRKKTVPISDKNHFCTVHYSDGNDAFVISYDSKSYAMTIVAGAERMSSIKRLLIGGTVQTASVSQKSVPEVVHKAPDIKAPAAASDKAKKAKKAKPAGEAAVSRQKPPQKEEAEKSKQPEKLAGSGFCIKKCEPQRYQSIILAITNIPAVIKSQNTVGAGTGQEVIMTDFQDGKKQRLSLQYMTKSRTLQLQGKESDFFKRAQLLLMESTDYQTAVQSYIDYSTASSEPQEKAAEPVKADDGKQAQAAVKPTGKKKKTAGQVESKLKKRLVYAYDFLSEQSRLLLTCAIVDIESKLSNYSGILINAYTALEHLISELQLKMGIKVKLIGQAFDKKDNRYILKTAYANRIDSIVYDEVMSALYTEYYKRNILAHSDNLSGVARILSDRNEAEIMLKGLHDVMNYNCKKLIEIGFLNKKN